MTRPHRLFRPLRAALLFSIGMVASAQQPAARLSVPITNDRKVTLTGSRSPLLAGAEDAGALPAQTALGNMTLVFSHTAAQGSDMEALLAAQENPASPQYHKWLTPEAYAARFGVNDADLAAVQTWLTSQGFSVSRVARSRDRLTFSGTAGQVSAAFGTELRRFRRGSETHFAPASDLTLPAALAPMVTAVLHLSDYRPKAHIRLPAAQPHYTSSLTQNHKLDPLDLATQYDVNPLYQAGYNGTGQSIAVVGQSWIDTQDASRFRSTLGLSTGNLPNLVLVPDSGIAAAMQGDEFESDVDVEYSGAMAPGATVYFVYTGDDPTAGGAFDALNYAVTEDIAPVISISYGDCEPDFSPTELASFSSVTQEANLQGQTIVSAAGDNGSEDCYGDTSLNTVQRETPAVDVPSAFGTVTGVGGLQMVANAYAASNTQYFGAANGSDNYSSLLSYVPEQVWNEDSAANGLSSGGGGTSISIPRPSYQTGVPGIPAGNFRLVPDVALQASTDSPGYVLCSSDASLYSGANTSCSNGLRDASNDLTTAGGTSFGAPILAGMLAVLNQAKNATGQGNINPTLYAIAGNSTTYASAFHDITTGTNACTAGASYCSASGQAVYAAGSGYDEASGLGSLDFANLVAAWPSTSATALIATSTYVVPISSAPTPGATQQISITVNNTAPNQPEASGTAQILVDGVAAPTPVTITAGVGSYSYTAPATAGTHVVTAIYSGDATHAASTGAAALTIGTTVASGGFSLNAPALTVAANSSGSTTVVITPSGGYTGTINFTLAASTSLSICYGIDQADAYAGRPLTATLSLGEGTACSGASVRAGTGGLIRAKGQTTSRNHTPSTPGTKWPEETAFAGLLLGVFTWKSRSRRLSALLSLTLLTALGFGLSGCGGGSGGSPTRIVSTPQTISVTLTGTDSVNGGITSSTTFNLSVQ